MRGEYFLFCATCTFKNRITPACAGSTPTGGGATPSYRDHPRLRGEYSNRWRSDTKLQGSPPLARGVHFTEGLENEEKRITPACAGSTHKARRYEIRNKDHPRLRGEYFCAHPRVQVFSGSPPLARGVRFCDKCILSITGITPACSGSTSNPCVGRSGG